MSDSRNTAGATGKIDPSRYAGHTPEPWSVLVARVGDLGLTAQNGATAVPNNSADAYLAADAPMLLRRALELQAENETLRRYAARLHQRGVLSRTELLEDVHRLSGQRATLLAERDSLRARLSGLRRRAEKLQVHNGGAAGALLWRHHVLELLEDDQS